MVERDKQTLWRAQRQVAPRRARAAAASKQTNERKTDLGAALEGLLVRHCKVCVPRLSVFALSAAIRSVGPVARVLLYLL